MYFIVDPQKLKPTTCTLLRDSSCRHKSLSLSIMHFVGLNLSALTIIVSLCQHRIQDWSFSEAHHILCTMHLCGTGFCFPEVLGSHYKVAVYILTTWSLLQHYSIGKFYSNVQRVASFTPTALSVLLFSYRNHALSPAIMQK